jgi:hypothetical protein
MKTCNLDPLFNLGAGGSARGKDNSGAFFRDPAGFNSGESFLIGIRKNTKFEMAFGEFRAISEGRRFEPILGRGVVVLG